MRRLIPTFTLFLLLALPAAVSAVTLDAPPRPLTAEENKLGSVYRGCIGFHCLEEPPVIGWTMTVADGCTAGDRPLVPGTLSGDGDVCLSLATNAREGAIVLVRSASGTGFACSRELSGGLAAATKTDGCTPAGASYEPVASSHDRLEDAEARFHVGGEKGESLVFMTVIAY